MLKNTIINRKATIKIGKALGELNSHLYFDGADERLEIIIDKMKAIVNGL